MGSKSSKGRKKGSLNASAVSSSGSLADTVVALGGGRGKSEREVNDEARAQRVGMLCHWINDSTAEDETADFLEQLRELCTELLARLYTKTELQLALQSGAGRLLSVVCKAMNQFPDSNEVVIAGLEILQLLETAPLENDYGSVRAGEQIIQVLEYMVKSRESHSTTQVFVEEHAQKLLLCADIIHEMLEGHPGAIAYEKIASTLLNALQMVPQNRRKEVSMIGFLLAERLCDKLENAEEITNTVLEYLITDGFTLHDIVASRWKSNMDSNVSPLLVSWLDREEKSDIDSRSRTGETALMIAAKSNQLATAKCLLDHGANPEVTDANGQTVLAIAVCAGYMALAKLLLDQAASIECVDNEGNTPLHHAVKTNHAELVNLIIDRAGADSVKTLLKLRNQSGLGVIHVCVWRQATIDDDQVSLGILKRIIEAGADVNGLTTTGASALILAVHRRRRMETLKVLIDAGCSKGTIFQGLTAYDVAVQEGADELECDLLRP